MYRFPMEGQGLFDAREAHIAPEQFGVVKHRSFWISGSIIGAIMDKMAAWEGFMDIPTLVDSRLMLMSGFMQLGLLRGCSICLKTQHG